MNESTAELERKVEDLNARLQRVEQSLASIHRDAAHGLHVPASVAPQRVERPHMPAVRAEPSLIPVLGRSLIALGGGYFLRALTESHMAPPTVGVGLGLLYVAFWIFMSSRQAAQGRTAPATASSLIAGLIAFPLVWEAAARFRLFSPEVASLLMLIVSGAFLMVAWRHGLVTAAWIVSFGALGCTVALMLSGEQIAIPLVSFAVVSAVLWHVAAERSWQVVPWPPLVASCVMCLSLQLLVAAGRGADGPAMAAVALLLVAVVYAAAASAKTLLRGQDMRTADAVLSAVAIVVALTGAARIASTVPRLDRWCAIAIGALSIGSYLLAITQPLSFKTARYFAAIAVPCMIIATSIPSTPTVAALVWILAAACSIAVAEWKSLPDFHVHAVVYALAAAFASGTLRSALWSISGIGSPSLLRQGSAAAATGIVMLAVLGILVRRSPSAPLTRASSIAFMSLGTVIVIAASSQVLLSSTSAEPASAAALRSGVIALAAVGLAILSRSSRFSDAAMLVYPVLGIGVAKFAVDDVISGRAATLFITFAAYGCALLLLARLRKTAAESGLESGSPDPPQAAVPAAGPAVEPQPGL